MNTRPEFRKEVYSNRKPAAIGAVFLAQPLSFRLVTWLIVSVTTTLLLFLSLVSYSQSLTVNGKITPLTDSPAQAIAATLDVPVTVLDFIEAGMEISLTLSDFPAERTPPLMATVSDWSDTPVTDPGELRYALRLKLDQQRFSSGNKTLQLSPGMNVTARFNLESRSLLNWILPSSFTGKSE